MKDIIFVSMEDWDEVWRRNQFVCAELMRREPGRKILFVGLPRDVSYAARSGKWERVWKKGTYGVGIEGITGTHAMKWWPDSVGVGRRLNEWGLRRHVRRVARRLGMRSPVLWLNPHHAVHMVGRMGEAAVVYDVTDDWTSLTQKESLRELVVRQDRELCGAADAVIVCSKRLYEMKVGMAREVHLIPNGVDAKHYSRVSEGGELPADIQEWKKPVAGYTGTVHPDRVDVGLVERLARSGKVSSVVLVGPNHLGEGDRAKLAGAGVVMTGAVPYARVPEYMRGFDVCIVPHRVTAFTESLNPIKLWEYLAAGKSIVSTDVAGFRDYPKLVTIARTEEEFVEGVGRALSEDPNLVEARKAEARGHSWAARVDEIEKVLTACVARREAARGG